MARKGVLYKRGGRSGQEDRTYIYTDEAGGTLVQTGHIGMLSGIFEVIRDIGAYNNLSAGEKTAVRAVTIGNIVDAVDSTLTEI